MSGGEIKISNLNNIEDNRTKLVLSGNTLFQVTGLTNVILNKKIVTTNYMLTSTDDVILVNDTIVITMPSINSANPSGYYIKNIGYGIINFNIYNNEYIDGYSEFGILNHNTSIRLIPYIDNWYVF